MEPLSPIEVATIKAEHPELPSEYLDYLLTCGYGETDSGRRIYSGPVKPESIYGQRFADSSIVLIGDDMQGYCFGFDKASRCFGEISDFGDWQPWPATRMFSDYVTDDG